MKKYCHDEPLLQFTLENYEYQLGDKQGYNLSLFNFACHYKLTNILQILIPFHLKLILHRYLQIIIEDLENQKKLFFNFMNLQFFLLLIMEDLSFFSIFYLPYILCDLHNLLDLCFYLFHTFYLFRNK